MRQPCLTSVRRPIELFLRAVGLPRPGSGSQRRSGRTSSSVPATAASAFSDELRFHMHTWSNEGAWFRTDPSSGRQSSAQALVATGTAPIDANPPTPPRTALPPGVAPGKSSEKFQGVAPDFFLATGLRVAVFVTAAFLGACCSRSASTCFLLRPRSAAIFSKNSCRGRVSVCSQL